MRSLNYKIYFKVFNFLDINKKSIKFRYIAQYFLEFKRTKNKIMMMINNII